MDNLEIEIIENAYNAKNESERIVGINCDGFVVEQDAQYTVDWVHAGIYTSLERFKANVQSRADKIASL